MLTVVLVILACIIALVIGIFVAAGIQANMKGISKKFGEVAKGDLTITRLCLLLGFRWREYPSWSHIPAHFLSVCQYLRESLQSLS